MKKLLVAFDGSESAKRALQYAIDQVRDTGASIHLLIAHPAPMLYPEIGGMIPYDTLLKRQVVGQRRPSSRRRTNSRRWA
jgi:nucleotide-binding universal stress UspA family protein